MGMISTRQMHVRVGGPVYPSTVAVLYYCIVVRGGVPGELPCIASTRKCKVYREMGAARMC